MAEPLVFWQEVSEAEQLLDDLTGREVPHHAVDAAGTEHAAHPAAHLGTHAHRPAGSVPQEHALDPLPIGEFEQQLFSAVYRPLVGRDRGGPDAEVFGEPFPQALRQVGHGGEGVGSSAKQPAPDRSGPPGRLFLLGEPAAEVDCRIEQVRPISGIGKHVERVGGGHGGGRGGGGFDWRPVGPKAKLSGDPNHTPRDPAAPTATVPSLP